MKKVLILNPPSFDNFQYVKEGRCESRKGGQLTPPVTLGIISALLTEQGIDNELYDMMARPVSGKRLNNILEKRFEIAFISVSAPTYRFDKKMAGLIRSKNKDCLICAIGVLPTALPKLILEDFDVAVIGEPEMTALEIVKNYKKDKNSLNQVKGICYRKGQNIIANDPRPVLQDLDSLPFPDRKKMPTRRYINPKTGKPFTVIKAQRGCPHSCSFCTASFYYGKKARYRSVGNVIREIKECIREHSIDDFMFLGDTFTINRKYILELCSAILDNSLKITWSCNSRIDTFDAELAESMKKAGCWFISFGVESGSEKIIKENLKRLYPKRAVESARICRDAGIVSMMYYVLGFPGETKKDMKKTIRLAMKVNSDLARFFVATPLPGSILFEKAYAGKLPDFQALTLSDTDANMSGLKNNELKAILRKAYLKYYIRPSQLYRTFAALSGNSFMNLLKLGRNYAKAYLL
ncbi:radical SAM protein [Candidatus Woesearchaeota archaeon]|nr:radical SAM protein [Candidatus Woesearchaeota archaeon]